MTMNFSMWEAAANARRLVDDLSYPESIRAMAGDVADLASLLEGGSGTFVQKVTVGN